MLYRILERVEYVKEQCRFVTHAAFLKARFGERAFMASSSPAVSSPPARRPLTDSVYRFMHRAPRCRARTRRGSLCQSPAMINGRCRMQGGTSPGAPMGNKNAFKHGRYTADAIAFRRFMAELIRNARQVCTGGTGHASVRQGFEFCRVGPGNFTPS